jgi:septal ring factor EnvC (AmiA/AmiB activator)
MRSATQAQTAQTLQSVIAIQRKGLLKALAAEQHKLETMIIKLMEKGRKNLGMDQSIVEQSQKLDQLVVDEMMLEEMLKSLE